jgi:hypothetical protein
MLLRERDQLRHADRRAAQCGVERDPFLQQCQAQVSESAALPRRERTGDADERLALPQREGLPEERTGLLQCALRRCDTRFSHEPLGLERVDAALVHLQVVAPGDRAQLPGHRGHARAVRTARHAPAQA